MVRVAINGFGRIGRMIFRAGLNDPKIDFVAINDLTDTANLAYLLKYDSAHGKLVDQVGFDSDHLIVDGKNIIVYAKKDPESLPWDDLDVDVVVECTGFFTKKELASKHLKAGAKKVLISAPSDDADITLVKGVNEHLYNKEQHNIISNASCTTNCMAPIVKVLNDNFKIEKAFMTTIHSYTSTQKSVDGPSRKDVRRGRAAAQNMIPTSTGAAKAVIKVIPELKGKVEAMAVRVPTINGSLIDLVALLNKDVSVEGLNSLFKNVSEYHLKGILEYSEEDYVSSDIINNSNSAIYDAKLTKANGNMIKIFAWYDNEWGYSNRMIDLIKLL